jgi:tRNA-splicing ligase RtcB
MPRVVNAPGQVPIWLWGRTVPDGALSQLERIASLPWVVEHVAAMPDLHVSSGVAVGTVFATEATVVPAALGGDLGCGMSAVRFDFPAARLSRLELEELLEAFGREIPVGDAVHRGRGVVVPEWLFARSLSTGSLERERDRLSRRHLATLGGGNHFLELDRDGGGDLWLLVHSGSRGLGAAIAHHHVRAAPGEEDDLRGLHLDTDAGRACLGDFDWAFAFARANREALAARAAALITSLIDVEPDPASRVDVHHNFVRLEPHCGRQLLVHRKGAIAAPSGERALIPGSMGTCSYLVAGRGEPRSFASASHGAGRVLTRKQARQEISPHRLRQGLRKVVFDEQRLRSLVEEAPQAYRDLNQVLEDEEDLVTPLIRLEPLAVLKG